MSTVLHPVGPHPRRVYWVRRLALLLVAVLLATMAWAVVRGGRSDAVEPAQAASAAAEGDAEGVVAGDAPDPAADDAATGDPVADDAAGPGACAPAELAVTVTTTSRSYAGEEQPVLTVGITNTGADGCTVDAGDAAREVVVTSGADRIWSSFDCPGANPERLLLLPAGARDEVQVTWPRVRSAAGCPADLPAPRAGTYTAVVHLLGASSGPAVFDLG